MNRLRRAAGDQRGSVLLISLVLVAVMTLLGLALFDLAQVETDLALGSETDARAFEVAQAGIERALDRLLRTMLAEDAASLRASWPNGSTVGGTTTALCTGGSVSGSDCDTTQFRPVNSAYISNTSLPAVAGRPDGGTYTLEFMLLTRAAATNGTPFSVPGGCIQDPAASAATDPCENVILVRSTGTVTGPPAGYTRSRTLQALLKADSTAVFAGGITAGSSGTGAIRGNAKIYGTIHILGDPSGIPLGFTGNSGQFNNWADLDATSLARLRPLPLVCPPGTSCPTDANMVYSLGAKLLVAKPADQAVDVGGSASIGTASNTAAYHTPARAGKGPIDEVRIGDGCTMPCEGGTGSFTSGSASRVHVDGGNLTRPYPGQPPAFPQLHDPTTVGATSYQHYACVAGSACFGAPAGQEFFVRRARRISDIPEIVAPNSLASASGLAQGLDPFAVSFSFTNKLGVVRYGAVCWRRPEAPTAPRLPGELISPVLKLLEFGISTVPISTTAEAYATCLSSPSTPSDPLLLYIEIPSAEVGTRGFSIREQTGPVSGRFVNYRGAAIFVTNGLVKIEETFQTCQDAVLCPNQFFPEHHMLGLLTTGEMHLGLDNSSIARIMGLFYTSGILYAKKQTNVLGTATAFKFCFGGAGAGEGCPLGSGSQVPSFFQVPQDPNTLPDELFLGGGSRWAIATVPGYWMECRRGPADATLPTTPTGVCSYQR